jgi:hypothetical protein
MVLVRKGTKQMNLREYIAQEVMGLTTSWEIVNLNDGRPPFRNLVDSNKKSVPYYDSNIIDAWKVVDHMISKGWEFNLRADEDAYCLDFTKPRPIDRYWKQDSLWGEHESKDLSDAICKAALEAVREEKKFIESMKQAGRSDELKLS